MENNMSSPAGMNAPEHDLIIEYVTKAMGGEPRIDRYGDKNEELNVDILSCPDRPQADLTSYSTIGLSDHPMPWGEGEFPTRLELAGVCESGRDSFPNILASAAFCIIRSGCVYHPGAVLPNYVRLVYPATQLPHLYLTAPFYWEKDLHTLDCVTRKVSWLLAVPISESEYQYLREHGEKAFESLLETAQIDVSDLERSPTV